MERHDLNLDVRWPDDRTVRVAVHVLPLVGLRKPGERERTLDAVHAIGPDQLDGPGGIVSFLSEITEFAADGDVVQAVCFDPDVGPLLSALHVTVPVPDPISVRLPAL